MTLFKSKKHRSLSRRSFLKLLGLGGAAAAATPQKVFSKGLYPLLNTPADRLPGFSYYIPSVCTDCSVGCSIVARNKQGQVVKIEGNPKSPTNRGTTCARGQASIHKHYHPDRIQAPLQQQGGKGKMVTWETARTSFADQVKKLVEDGRGGRIRVLGPAEHSSLGTLLDTWTESLGAPKPVAYEAVAYEHVAAANKLTFGVAEAPKYHIAKATYIVSFGADFLASFGSSTSYSADFMLYRAEQGSDEPTTEGNPLLYFGPRMTTTAIAADHYGILPPGTEHYVTLAMVHSILSNGLQRTGSPSELSKIRDFVKDFSPEAVSEVTGIPVEELEDFARNFANAEAPLAIAGDTNQQTSEATQAVVAANILNYICGAVNRTVEYGAGVSWATAQSYAKTIELIEEMKAGKVDLLITYGTNPAYSLSSELGFAEAVEKVPYVVSFNVLPDETSDLADLVIPIHTNLESWVDAYPVNGVAFLGKPTMEPALYTFNYNKEYFDKENRKLPTGELPQSTHMGTFFLETASLIGGSVAKALEFESYEAFLKSEWKKIHETAKVSKSFEEFWEESLENGGFWIDVPAKKVAFKADGLTTLTLTKPLQIDDERLVTYPHLYLHDGRGANIPLLQELPDPISSVAWGSYAEVSAYTKLGTNFRFGDLIDVERDGQSFDIPTFAHGAVNDQTVAIALGQGGKILPYTRTLSGIDKVGINIVEYLPSQPEPLSGGPIRSGVPIKASKVRSRTRVAHTSGSFDQLGRGLVQAEMPDGEVIGHTDEDTIIPTAYKGMIHVDTSSGKSQGKRDGLYAEMVHEGTDGHGGDGHGSNGHGAAKAAAATMAAEGHSSNGHGSNGPGSSKGHGSSNGHGNGNGHGDHGDSHGGHGNYETIYRKQEFPNYRWGMAIDLDKCTGCGACVAACYIENNVPVVGRERILEGREMSWIHVTRYEMDPGEGEKPRSGFSLMLCQQCTNAPCEPVCPVLAAYHTSDGLNAQVYNRCIGTRYCANNCPYKVRRFNFFDYSYPEFLAISYNPDLWVRPVGVMEKCTFCIQRIRDGKDKAKDEKRLVRDGEIVPACQQSCSTGAITFGNLLDPESEVSKLANSERAYRVLDHHGPDPAVYYLRKVVRKA